MSKPRLASAFLALLSGVAACGKGSSHAVAAASFPTECEQSGDCAAVFDGELSCGGGNSRCPNAAIRLDALDAFKQEVSRRAPTCDAVESCGGPASCGGGALTCRRGRCEFTTWASDVDGAAAAERAVWAKDYARACTGVADCKPVYEGTFGCCTQACANTAISQGAYAQYEKDVGARAPICVPIPSCVPPDACPSGRVACTNGTCELLLAPS
jgi:hypothetical protein